MKKKTNISIFIAIQQYSDEDASTVNYGRWQIAKSLYNFIASGVGFFFGVFHVYHPRLFFSFAIFTHSVFLLRHFHRNGTRLKVVTIFFTSTQKYVKCLNVCVFVLFFPISVFLYVCVWISHYITDRDFPLFSVMKLNT